MKTIKSQTTAEKVIQAPPAERQPLGLPQDTPRRYFLLNIKHPHQWPCGQTAARHWLGKGILRAPIFYGVHRIPELLSGNANLASKARNEAKLFLTLPELARTEGFQPVIVTIDDGTVWFYGPAKGAFSQEASDRETLPATANDVEARPKFFPICHLREPLACSDVPLVLATMRANPAFCRGTFTEILPARYPGNIGAICAKLGFPVAPNICSLDVLSPVEFETLVAKVFEEAGCFVPAHRGGTGEAVDLFVDTQTIAADVLPCKTNGVISVQVKLHLPSSVAALSDWLQRSDRHWLIVNDLLSDLQRGSFGVASPRVLDRSWTEDLLARSESTSKWLKRSTYWLALATSGRSRNSEGFEC